MSPLTRATTRSTTSASCPAKAAGETASRVAKAMRVGNSAISSGAPVRGPGILVSVLLAPSEVNQDPQAEVVDPAARRKQQNGRPSSSRRIRSRRAGIRRSASTADISRTSFASASASVIRCWARTWRNAADGSCYLRVGHGQVREHALHSEFDDLLRVSDRRVPELAGEGVFHALPVVARTRQQFARRLVVVHAAAGVVRGRPSRRGGGQA